MFTALFVQTFNKVFLLVDYYSNTNKYAQHCENKSRPQMHCNGKCQVIKKLQQEESKDQQNPERKGDDKSEVVFYVKSSFASVPQYMIGSELPAYAILFVPDTLNRSIGIFRPPQAC